MPVRIRLTRTGAKKTPSYRIVVTDSRRARDSKSIEIIGHYHPVLKDKPLVVNEERALDWLSKGAKTTSTVQRLFKQTGVMRKFHETKTIKSKKNLEG
ncbi:MAG: 30S ribosomal protein S16 [bacterium]